MRLKKPKPLRPVRPNVGLEAAYQDKLDRLIDGMHRSIMRWVIAAYRSNPPEMAADAKRKLPADQLAEVIKELSERWLEKFDEAAEGMAEYFSEDMEDRVSSQMKIILRDGGISVKFKPTRMMRDAVAATTAENVALIKSIPRKYLGDVEGLVMRSVNTGRDLESLSKDLQKRYGLTRKRAALIARDQNNKATSTFNRARQIEAGINEAVWKHSHAGKEPRPTHVAMNGKKYDVNKGMWDPAVKEFIFPGQLINCRCTSQSVIPGFAP